MGFLLALQGCVQRSSGAPGGKEPIGPIYGSRTVQQTLTLRNLTLTAVDVRVATYARVNQGDVVLRVRTDPSSTEDLRTARVAAAAIRDSALSRFAFEPLDGPRSLTVVLESTAADEENAVAVWSVPADDRRDGAMYEGERLDQRVVLAPVYQQGLVHALGAELAGLTRWPLTTWAAVFLLLLPGALLAWLFLGPRYRVVDRLAAAPAFAAAFIPLVLLWSTQLDVHPAFVAVGAIMAAYNAGSVAELIVRRRTEPTIPRHQPMRPSGPSSLSRGLAPFGVALVAVLVGLLARSVALSGTAVPPGGDAFHHALITRLIIDHGTVPTSYLPYVPIASFAYHFGFHAIAAPISMVTGGSATFGVGAAALLLNGLIALSVFFCARALRLGDTAATAAAVVVALVSPFPAGLLDAARYPQTAGLLILPVAVVVAIAAASGVGGVEKLPASLARRHQSSEDASSRPVSESADDGVDPGSATLERIRQAAALGFLGAGLFLTHYRVAMSLVLLVAIVLAWRGLRGSRQRPWVSTFTTARLALAPLGWSLLLGLGLVLPWLARLLSSFTLGIRESNGRYGPEYFSLERLGTGVAQPAFWLLLGLGLAGLVLAVARRRVGLALVGLWTLALVAFSNPHWLPVPGAGALDSVTVFSSLFFPAALAAGHVAHEVRSALDRAVRYAGATAVAGALGAAAVWGAVQIPTLVEPNNALADSGDRQAARWVAARLPADAKLLVNSAVRPWNPDYVVPTDGGYWLPLLARRATTLLPLVYPGERGVAPGDIERMERLSRASARIGAPETLAALRESGVTHIYLGARGGPIEEATLAQSSAFRRIYRRGAVSIYEVTGATSLAEAPPANGAQARATGP